MEDRGAWTAAVHGVAKGWTQLSNGTTTKKNPYLQKMNRKSKRDSLDNGMFFQPKRSTFLTQAATEMNLENTVLRESEPAAKDSMECESIHRKRPKQGNPQTGS